MGTTVLLEKMGRGVKSGKRRRKDPNAPKRPMAAYMLYSNSIREEMRRRFPKLGQMDLSKEIGKAWKKMRDQEKRPWQQKAEKEKKRYARAMASYESKV